MKNMNHLNKVLLLSLISLSLISSNVSAGWLGRPRSNSAPAAISASGVRQAGGACANWVRNHPGKTAIWAAALAGGAGLATWGIKKFNNWRNNRPEDGNAQAAGGNEGAGSGEAAPKKTWGDTARTAGSYALAPVRFVCRHPYATTAVALPTVAAVVVWACPRVRNAALSAARSAAGRAGSLVPQRVSNHPWLSTGSAVAGSAAVYGGARGVQAASACCARQERKTQDSVLKLAELFMCEANLAVNPENAELKGQRGDILKWFEENGKQDICHQLVLNEGNPALVMLNLLRAYSGRDWARSVEQAINAEINIEGQAYTLASMFRTYKQNVAAARKSGDAETKQRQINAWLGMMEERIQTVRSVVTALLVQVPAEAPTTGDAVE